MFAYIYLSNNCNDYCGNSGGNNISIAICVYTGCPAAD